LIEEAMGIVGDRACAKAQKNQELSAVQSHTKGVKELVEIFAPITLACLF
jgi:hypothetical protein